MFADCIERIASMGGSGDDTSAPAPVRAESPKPTEDHKDEPSVVKSEPPKEEPSVKADSPKSSRPVSAKKEDDKPVVEEKPTESAPPPEAEEIKDKQADS